MKNNVRPLLVALNRETNQIVATKSRTEVAKHLDIAYRTLQRRLADNGEHHCDAYSIWATEIIKIKRNNNGINNL